MQREGKTEMRMDTREPAVAHRARIDRVRSPNTGGPGQLTGPSDGVGGTRENAGGIGSLVFVEVGVG